LYSFGASHSQVTWREDGAELYFNDGPDMYGLKADGTKLWLIASASPEDPEERKTSNSGTRGRSGRRIGLRTAFDLARDGSNLVYGTCVYGRIYPDGDGRKRIANDFEYELARVARDGGSVTSLTMNEHFDSYPAWSPNGQRIAFLSNRFNANLSHLDRVSTGARIGLYTMAADGSDVRPVFEEGTPVAHQPPRWSPDGRELAVVRYRDPGTDFPLRPEGRDLYVVGADGSAPRSLATDVVSGASWSPDGSRLAYAQAEGSGVALYTIGRDGADPRRLTTVERWWRRNDDEDPRSVWIDTVAWSPDGSRILVSANGNHPAFVVGVDIPSRTEVGIVRREVGPSRSPRHEFQGIRAAAWSPDGRQIVMVGPLRDSFGPATVVAIVSLDGEANPVRRLAERAEADAPLLAMHARAA